MDGPKNYAKGSQSDNETPTSYAIAYMWNLKKGHNELCRTDPDSEKSYGFQRRQVGGWGDGLGVWDRNAIKLGCDDCCTTINVILSTE